MLKKITNNKKLVISSLLAIVHVCATFFTDKLFFTYKNNLDTIFLLVLYKSLLLIILTISYYKIINIIKNKEYKTRQFKYFLIYFSIMMFFLLLTWPGIWRNDDIETLLIIQELTIHSWHHLFTSIIYILSLMIIPIPSGVIIILNIIYSIIVSYIINSIVKKIKKPKWYHTFILFIPFLLPAVIDNNLYPLRTIIYGYIELFTVFYIINIYKENKKLTLRQIIVLLLSTVILITYRSEAIIFILLIPIFLITYQKNKIITRKQLITFLIIILIAIVGINKINKNILIEQYGDKYRITLSDGFIKDAIDIAIKEKNEKALEAFNKAFSIDQIKENPNIWIGKMRVKNPSTQATNEFLKEYIQFVIKHPREFTKNRIESYIYSNSFKPNRNLSIFNSSILYDETEDKNTLYAYKLVEKTEGRFFHPINRKIRKSTIQLLEGLHEDGTTTIIYTLFWNSLFPSIVIAITSLYLLFNKKWFEFIITISILVKELMVIASAPENYFMYYFSEYLIGFTLLALIIEKIITTKKQQ